MLYEIESKFSISSRYDKIIYKVLAVNVSTEEEIQLSVISNDFGVAIVEAYVFLLNENIKARINSVIDEYNDVYRISNLSNNLLTNYLTDANRLLIASFISYCNEDCEYGSANELEELRTHEVESHTVNGKVHSGYLGPTLTTDYIKKSHSSIWESYLFYESTGMDYPTMMEFTKCKKLKNSTEVLYWTFLLCLWGGYNCNFPYKLYKGIVSGEFEKCVDVCYEFRKLLFGV